MRECSPQIARSRPGLRSRNPGSVHDFETVDVLLADLHELGSGATKALLNALQLPWPHNSIYGRGSRPKAEWPSHGPLRALSGHADDTHGIRYFELRSSSSPSDVISTGLLAVPVHSCSAGIGVAQGAHSDHSGSRPLAPSGGSPPARGDFSPMGRLMEVGGHPGAGASGQEDAGVLKNPLDVGF